MQTIRKPQEYKQARELRLDGWTLKAIAKEVGVHKTTVQEWVVDLPGLRHTLSEIDESNREGTCIHCGRVKIRKNGYPNGARWLCGASAKVSYERNVARAQEKFYEYICTQHCADCSNDNPLVLEFDHIGDNKRYNVADMVRKGYSWTTILVEIQKCEVVCANCHKIRTNQRAGWFRHRLQNAAA